MVAYQLFLCTTNFIEMILTIILCSHYSHLMLEIKNKNNFSILDNVFDDILCLTYWDSFKRFPQCKMYISSSTENYTSCLIAKGHMFSNIISAVLRNEAKHDSRIF